MKLRDIIIAVVWVYFLATALYKGMMAGHVVDSPGVPSGGPPAFTLAAWLFAFTVFAVGGFLGRGRPVFGEWVQRWVDRKWGAGTYAAITMRLRPMALFMLTILTNGASGLLSNYGDAQGFTYVTSTFSLSCGLGLLVAYLLSLRFPPRMY
jgi:hypothetical protein